MPTVNEVCLAVRSKNAGPYWVTFDFFFDGEKNFQQYAQSKALSPESFANIFGAEPALVKTFLVENLNIVKISFPRSSPQGGVVERDLHCGQQFVRILDIQL